MPTPVLRSNATSPYGLVGLVARLVTTATTTGPTVAAPAPTADDAVATTGTGRPASTDATEGRPDARGTGGLRRNAVAPSVATTEAYGTTVAASKVAAVLSPYVSVARGNATGVAGSAGPPRVLPTRTAPVALACRPASVMPFRPASVTTAAAATAIATLQDGTKP